MNILFLEGSFESFKETDDSMLAMIQLLDLRNDDADPLISKEEHHKDQIKQELANTFLQEFFLHTKDPKITVNLLTLLMQTKTSSYSDSDSDSVSDSDSDDDVSDGMTLGKVFFGFEKNILMIDETKKSANFHQLKGRIIQIIIQIIKQQQQLENSSSNNEGITDDDNVLKCAVKLLVKKVNIVEAFEFMSENSKNENIKSVAERFIPTLIKLRSLH